jgi:hypothetical protein
MYTKQLKIYTGSANSVETLEHWSDTPSVRSVLLTQIAAVKDMRYITSSRQF